MKLTTPFKAQAEFEKDLKAFANKHKTVMESHASRISDFFEMACYNLVISYYENLGYRMEVQNLQGKRFRYKCSPNGKLVNFSYFKANKQSEDGTSEDVFFIYHNATVQSYYDDGVFTTPDIVISATDKSIENKDYYDNKKVLTYIPKEALISFFEAKHLVPFPELMFNFIGTVHELMPKCIDANMECDMGNHIAPSLMMSGSFGKATKNIKTAFEKRYAINYLDNLINASAAVFRMKILNKEE